MNTQTRQKSSTYSTDKYGNHFITIKKTLSQIQFQSSQSLIQASKTLLLSKILITKGYSLKLVKQYLKLTSCKLQISQQQFKSLNKKIIQTTLNYIQEFVKVYCMENIQNLIQLVENRKLILQLLRFQQILDTGFQDTFVKFIKAAYNLDELVIYVEEAIALYQKIVSLVEKLNKGDWKSKNKRNTINNKQPKTIAKSNQKKEINKNNKPKDQKKPTVSTQSVISIDDKNNYSSSSSSSQSSGSSSSSSNSSSQNSLKPLNKKKSSVECTKTKPKQKIIKQVKPQFPIKFRKILILTQSKPDKQRIFVAKILLQKGTGGCSKINQYIYENKLKREDFPEIHQTDYKKIFSAVTMKICRYLEFILTDNNNSEVKQFSLDEMSNLEKYFMNYKQFFIAKQRQIFQNVLRLSFNLTGIQKLDSSEYWPLYIQMTSLAVKQLVQEQTDIIPKHIPKAFLPRPQQKAPKPYEYRFDNSSTKKVNQILSRYSQSHKRQLQVKKKQYNDGIWYKQNNNQICVLSEDDSLIQEQVQQPHNVIKPTPVPSNIPEYLTKHSYIPTANDFQLCSLINYKNESLHVTQIQIQILKIFLAEQKPRKVQDSMNKKYNSSGKRFDIQTINRYLVSLLLKAVKHLRDEYLQNPQELPQLTLINANQMSYMIHVTSYRSCKYQLLNFYRNSALLKQEIDKQSKIGRIYFLIELTNDTLGRMRFEMKRVGERRVQLMIQGKCGEYQFEK